MITVSSCSLSVPPLLWAEVLQGHQILDHNEDVGPCNALLAIERGKDKGDTDRARSSAYPHATADAAAAAGGKHGEA